MNHKKILPALIVATIFHVTLCGVSSAVEQEEDPKPKVTLNAGTQNDVEEALIVLRKFLDGWESRDYQSAASHVLEPVRKDFVQEMKKRPMKLQRIEDISVSERKGHLRARIHIAADPDVNREDLTKRGIGIDMIRTEGQWWITAR